MSLKIILLFILPLAYGIEFGELMFRYEKFVNKLLEDDKIKDSICINRGGWIYTNDIYSFDKLYCFDKFYYEDKEIICFMIYEDISCIPINYYKFKIFNRYPLIIPKIQDLLAPFIYTSSNSYESFNFITYFLNLLS